MLPVIAPGHQASEAGIDASELFWHVYVVWESNPVQAKEAALDIFHAEVPIKMLECVDIWDRVSDCNPPSTKRKKQISKLP